MKTPSLLSLLVTALCSLLPAASQTHNISSQNDVTMHSYDVLSFTVNGVSFSMVKVDGGSFLMGADDDNNEALDDEKPSHQVTLSDYYIGQTEVTQALWKAVMGNNPSSSKGRNRPVELVSWNDCQEFISKLNALTGKRFSLPTEAEWEFAARGGNKSQGYKYSGSNDLDAVAWYSSNCDDEAHAVAKKQPNELGIYDMTGNVLEWCLDWKGSYSSNSQTNPRGPSMGSERVFRGGSWFNMGNNHVSCRYSGTPISSLSFLGLRLALHKAQ